MSWAELLGFLTGLVTVALAVPQRVETFPVGIANNVFFLVLFWDARLYADAGLPVVLALLSAMGWWAWLRLGPRRGPLVVSDATPVLLLATAGGIVAATLILMPVLREAPQSGSPPPARGSPRCSGPRAHSRIPAHPLRPWTLRRTDSQPPSTSRSASPAARSIRSATSAAGWRQRPST